jgi:hypothetical protein
MTALQPRQTNGVGSRSPFVTVDTLWTLARQPTPCASTVPAATSRQTLAQVTQVQVCESHLMVKGDTSEKDRQLCGRMPLASTPAHALQRTQSGVAGLHYLQHSCPDVWACTQEAQRTPNYMHQASDEPPSAGVLVRPMPVEQRLQQQQLQQCPPPHPYPITHIHTHASRSVNRQPTRRTFPRSDGRGSLPLVSTPLIVRPDKPPCVYLYPVQGCPRHVMQQTQVMHSHV